MPAARLHLVRHGEVHNPDGILYGRLPNFHLSDKGRLMADLAVAAVAEQGRPISKLLSSPLLRAQQSAAPFAEHFGLDVVTDERLIEPYNLFEGKKMSAGRIALRPHLFFHLRNPRKPSWGEPFESIASRMHDLMDSIWESTQGGDVVLVSHQAPIWIFHLSVFGKKPSADPRKRRCGLSSITSFEKVNGNWHEVSYLDTSENLEAKDLGAV
jgi:broad specificity phosphatase PhoE